MASAYAQGFFSRGGGNYNRKSSFLLSQSSTRDADNGSLRSVTGGGVRAGQSGSNGHRRNNGGGIQRFQQQQRTMSLSQHDDHHQTEPPEIMVDHTAGGEFSLSQGTEITLTQAFEPEKKQQRSNSSSTNNMKRSSSSSSGARNDNGASINRHLAGRTPRAMGGRGGGRSSSIPFNQKRQQQNNNVAPPSQKKNHRNSNNNNPNHQQQRHHKNNHQHHQFMTPVAGSGRLLTSNKSVGSRHLSQWEDDSSTIQSRSLLTQESQGGSSRFGQQQRQQQQQQQHQHSMMKQSMLSTPHNNNVGQQQHSSSMAMTSSNNNNTSHNTVYPQRNIPTLSSTRRPPVSTAVRAFGGGISNTLATLATPSKAFRSMTSFAARTAARTGATLGLTPRNFKSRSSLLSSSRITASYCATNAVTGVVQQQKQDDDDASKVTQKTYDHSIAAREEAAAKEKVKMDDFLTKVQTVMDDKMKQFDDGLNAKFAEKKQELEEFFDRTTKTFKESMTKMEGIQEAMDSFPDKIAVSAEEHERQINQLMRQSKDDMEKERLRVVESVSSNARAVAEEEARKTIGEVVSGVIAAAKSELEQWTDGVLASVKSSIVGNNQVANSSEAMDCAEEEERYQPTAIYRGQGRQSNVDRENKESVNEQEIGLSEEVIDTELGIQNSDDYQSGKWSKDCNDESGDEEVSKKGATPFSSKATPRYQSGMSTTTTPFSRKTTPLKSNYGKNRHSINSSRSKYDDDLQTELENDFRVVPSPHPKKPSSSKKKRGGCSPPSPQAQADTTKVKSVKKAPKSASKHKITSKTPKKSPRYSQTSKEDEPSGKLPKVTQSISLDDIVDKSTKKKVANKAENAPPQLSQHSLSQNSGRKRNLSALNADEQNTTRRSKRHKESNRVEKVTLKTRAEQAALKTQKKKAKAAKAKQVTPLDDGQRRSAPTKKDNNNPLSSIFCPSSPESNDEYNFDTELHSYPKLNGDDDTDELVGTSVIVAGAEGSGDGSSSGLDDSPAEKRASKSSLNLFTFGLVSRSKPKKNKKSYASKSRRKKGGHKKTKITLW
ncbi:hypothetical protein ACHAWC_009720 [Mediolabrus comicus]